MRSIGWSQLVERLGNLVQMLVREELIDRHIVVAPREMGGSTWLLTRARRTRDGVDGNVVLEQVQVSGRQQSNLDGGGFIRDGSKA